MIYCPLLKHNSSVVELFPLWIKRSPVLARLGGSIYKRILNSGSKLNPKIGYKGELSLKTLRRKKVSDHPKSSSPFRNTFYFFSTLFKPWNSVRWRSGSCSWQQHLRRRSGIWLESCRDPHAWPALHDRFDRGQLHGPWTAQNWHLQCVMGTDRLLECFFWNAELSFASHSLSDDGKTVDGPRNATMRAIVQGVNEGRRGLGNIYVWASGDGESKLKWNSTWIGDTRISNFRIGGEEDDCNCDGYAASMWTISINSAINDGQNAHYDESCSSTLASTFSNGAKDPNTGVVWRANTISSYLAHSPYVCFRRRLICTESARQHTRERRRRHLKRRACLRSH